MAYQLLSSSEGPKVQNETVVPVRNLGCICWLQQTWTGLFLKFEFAVSESAFRYV